MNGFLAMAEAFLDRMTNPRYGTDVNDGYTLRFNQLVTEDRQFATAFANLALDPEDIGSLPMCAWPWYLQWRATRADPPSPDFLDALFDATADPAVRMAVVQSGMSEGGERSAPFRPGYADEADRPPEASAGAFDDASAPPRLPAVRDQPTAGEYRYGQRPAPIRSRWLRRTVARLPESDRSVTSTIELAAQLLQLGDPESLSTLRQLLARDWPGRQALHNSIARHLADAELGQEVTAEWHARLGITQAP